MDVLTGQRRPRDAGEKRPRRKTTVGALCSHGRSATSVGEEADRGGEGSRGPATTWASCWTRSRARSRRGGEGPELDDALGAANGSRVRALLCH